ncbi:MAG: hypothetical protein QNJ69_13530 [Gammaproteobacteria bacterium]|nr:hypothetical protein [Gammaproteobacteria bacterium]
MKSLHPQAFFWLFLTMQRKELPDWARWVAMDADGQWWCYQAEPHRHDRGWYENEVGQVARVGYIDSTDIDWRDSLLRLAK